MPGYADVTSPPPSPLTVAQAQGALELAARQIVSAMRLLDEV